MSTQTILAGSALWLATADQASTLRDRLSKALLAYTGRSIPLSLRSLKLASGVLFTLGLLRLVNRAANRLSLNNWAISSDKHQWNWPQEVAVVTGGCSGIGLLIVKGLLNKGVKIAVIDVQLPTEDIEGNVFFCKTDITDPDAIAAAAADIKAQLGPVTILVNNAGIGSPGDLLEDSPKVVQKLFAVNLLSHWYTVQQFVPHMIKINKGHVVTTASMASFGTVANHVSYACSKVGALAFHEGLTSLLATKHKASRVHTTIVHPSFVKTPLVKDQDLAKMKFVLEPEEVSQPVLDSIFDCRSRQIILPNALYPVSMLRAAPHWLANAFRNMLAREAFNL